MSTQRSHAASRGLLAGAGLAFVAFAASLALGNSGSGDVPTSPQLRGEPQAQFTPTDEEPCAGAIASEVADDALASRAAKSGFHIYLPNHPSASATSVQGTWWCPRSSSVRVEFRSGVILSLESGSKLGDVGSHWLQLAEQGDGSTVALSGGTALVHQRGSDEKAGVNTLQFVTKDGTWISLRGAGATEVIELADIGETFKVDAQ